MSSSRRVFVKKGFVAAGGLMLWPSGCRDNDHPSVGGLDTVDELEPSYLELERMGALEQREAALWEMMSSCRCCPRECGANRIAGEVGVCSSTAELKVKGAARHWGEERPLVGSGASGTVFFSHCNLLCCFCLNWEINHRGDGSFVSHQRLAKMMLEVQEMGCHNVNLVTPTHVVPHIVKALRLAIPRGLRLPLVYNTSAYDSLEVIRLLDGVVDIYLPDFKYQDSEYAAHYSSGAADYPQVAAAVIKEMHRQVGNLTLDSNAVAQRGLIIRHLVMPHNIAGTDRFVRWVAEELSPDTYVNVMDQYRPMHQAFEYPKIARRLTTEEWQQAVDWAHEAGLESLDHEL